MKTTKQMQERIQKWEGLRLSSYLCPSGVWTIGYGHTKGVVRGQAITAAQAQAYFEEDLGAVESELDSLLKSAAVSLSQNRWDALVSFVFNLGMPKFSGSTLWRKIKANQEDPTIAREFTRWVYDSTSTKLPGLVKRRTVEARVWSETE